MSVADELVMDALEELNFMRKSEKNIQKKTNNDLYDLVKKIQM